MDKSSLAGLRKRPGVDCPAMPRRKVTLPPLKLATDETFGERLARLRKERGLTQFELADRVGIIHSLMTDYERGKIRLNAEMICRFTQVLGVSADEFLGLKRHAHVAGDEDRLPLKLTRRIKRIARLPLPQQKVLLRTIDGFLRGEGVGA